MKWIFGIITLATTASSFASPWQPPTYETQKVTYKLERRELSFKNDKYEFKVTTICSGESEMAVPDLRNMPPGTFWEAPRPTICTAIVDGREREFWISFNAAVGNDGVYKSVKTYSHSMWFRPLDNQPENIPPAEPNWARTRDLNLKNLILESSPAQGVTCMGSSGKETTPVSLLNIAPAGTYDNCVVINPVVYAATAEFETR
ncbi:hypothetical protein AZI86_16710 [Bdellovibrio bacteriovorus]|uniref:Uncharacterized protein n=1 Tax=Bdellovibrio bacteriovorus TaxID=959 RepID=A0A150WH17_BDEBC|nr:hypothetical protein [Bdellovibrio bacteriovorus]KYG62473.1 hypothetical protein AZI86_16710 [Bdellovibrio bacteriovorus]